MTSFLLDTHTFIWLSEDDASLPKNLRSMIEEADSVYVSIVSLWEIAIKLNIGKSLHKSYETIGTEIESSDLTLLLISFADTVQVRKLPLHHRDPFDRMLVAQAINHSLTIISQDTQLDAYSIQRLWT